MSRIYPAVEDVIPAVVGRDLMNISECGRFLPKAAGMTEGHVIPAAVGRDPMNKMYYTYILSNRKNGVLYTGVTSNLIKRMHEHKNNLVEGFTSRYNVHNLVYFEGYEDVKEAITREKHLKVWKREWKIRLIEKDNPCWEDLYEGLIKE